MSNKWYSETYDNLPDDFDCEKDLLLALCLYADQTGTDAYQRYPLELWLFSLLLAKRHVREHDYAWHHFGFIPSLDKGGANVSVDENGNVNEEDSPSGQPGESASNIQAYHDMLAFLLEDLKALQADPPYMWVNMGGVWRYMRIILVLGPIFGDQKSQDFACGQKATNGGGAGWIHRLCMCSANNVTNTSRPVKELGLPCSPINTKIVSRLNELALGYSAASTVAIANDSALDCYLKRQQKLAVALLSRPYTMHPLRNAFDGVDFGSNPWGVFAATADDHLHSWEAGGAENVLKSPTLD